MKRQFVQLFISVFLGLSAAGNAQIAQMSAEDNAVRTLINNFELGLNERSIAKIEAVVASDLVVLENGHRNDGWPNFRDHHLIPEMKEPSPVTKSELVKLKTSSHMAWAYTKTEMQLTDKSGKSVDALLWSAYVLERRAGEWKIVFLDWSMRMPKKAID